MTALTEIVGSPATAGEALAQRLDAMAAVAAVDAATWCAQACARQAAATYPHVAVEVACLRWLSDRVRPVQEAGEWVVGLAPLLEVGAGDCDDLCAALAALLLALGVVDVAFVVVETTGLAFGSAPWHVYVRAGPWVLDPYVGAAWPLAVPIG